MRELPVDDPTTVSMPEDAYFCAYCGSLITSPRHRSERDGSFGHRFSNPAGMVFDVGCFAEAPGCLHAGAYTAKDTWFRGTRWCTALCESCQSHLGWHYRAARRPGFYALIMERLIAPATR